MIVVIGGVKGGTGKTTIATNLTVLRAATGKKVLLVDGDEQKSTSTWAQQRDSMGRKTSWTTVAMAGKDILHQVPRMLTDYDDVIIDVGGRETKSLRAAMAIGDIFLIPFRPRSLDMWTLPDIKNLIDEMQPANPKLKCYAFINQADFRGNENDETLDILKECPTIQCLENKIGARKAFSTASTDGLGVSEMLVPDPKAIKEMQDLYDIVYKNCTQNVQP